MKLLNKTAKKMGLRKPKYRQVNIKPEAYMTFRILAAQRKRNQVDFFAELLSIYVDCKHKKHEDVIADLLKKQDALVDELKLYRERIGKIYR